jgi:hypothetical protein
MIVLLVSEPKKIIAKSHAKDLFSPVISYRSFVVSGFTLKSLLQFELTFAWGVR